MKIFRKEAINAALGVKVKSNAFSNISYRSDLRPTNSIFYSYWIVKFYRWQSLPIYFM